MPQCGHRQYNHVETLLAAQQILNIVHDIFLHVVDVLHTGLRTRQIQHSGISLYMNNRSTRLNSLRSYIAVAAEQIEKRNVCQVKTTLDAFTYPLAAGQVTAAQSDATACVETTRHCYTSQHHRPGSW